MRARLIADGHLTATTRAMIDVRDVEAPAYTEAQPIIAAALREGGLPHVRRPLPFPMPPLVRTIADADAAQTVNDLKIGGVDFIKVGESRVPGAGSRRHDGDGCATGGDDLQALSAIR